MADIFISYKRKNREWAEALSRALESQGWTTWWDTRLAAGESFDKVIERQLDAAKCVIVLWSKESVESKWVIAEAGEGLEREIIVPVFIEEARPPLVFRRIHTASLIGWKKSAEEAMFVRLIADVSRILGPSPKEQEENARKEELRQMQALERAKADKKEAFAKLKQEAEREENQLVQERGQYNEGSRSSTKTSNRLAPTFLNCKGMEFVLIKPGTYIMGGNFDFLSNLLFKVIPIHQVTINQAFYLGKYQVTQEEWYAVMGNNPSHFRGDSRPVENVSWNDVQEFLSLLNKDEGCDGCHRLPTEAEWEYVCRAGTVTAYSFGDDVNQLGDYAWYEGNSKNQTHPVGEKRPNQWGLYDMHGNVWEWVQDYHGKYSNKPQTDPAGPASGSYRVIRGGGWISDARRARSAHRYGNSPDDRSYDVGFRVLRTYP